MSCWNEGRKGRIVGRCRFFIKMEKTVSTGIGFAVFPGEHKAASKKKDKGKAG